MTFRVAYRDNSKATQDIEAPTARDAATIFFARHPRAVGDYILVRSDDPVPERFFTGDLRDPQGNNQMSDQMPPPQPPPKTPLQVITVILLAVIALILLLVLGPIAKAIWAPAPMSHPYEDVRVRY